MNCLEVRELVIIGIHTDTEEKPRISSVYHFIISKLREIRSENENRTVGTSAHFDEVGLILLVSRSYETVDFPS